jgi:hypothetical protein
VDEERNKFQGTALLVLGKVGFFSGKKWLKLKNSSRRKNKRGERFI